MNYWSSYEKFYFIVNLLLVLFSILALVFFVYLIIRYKRLNKSNSDSFNKLYSWQWSIISFVLILTFVLGIADIVIDALMVEQYSNSYMIGVTLHNWVMFVNCFLLVVFFILCYFFFYKRKREANHLLAS